MMKDPADKEEAPYEVLGLGFEPSRDQVHKALPNFMRDRRNFPRIGQAQKAVQRLQSPKARAAVDLWLYEVGSSAGAAIPGAAPPRLPSVREFTRVEPMAPECLYCDLDAADASHDCRAIEPITIRLSDIPSMDGLDKVRLRPAFDR